MSETVIFLHIGKTAGTTLRRILRRHYRGDDLMTVRVRRRPREQTLAEFAALPEEVRARPRLVLGHTVYGLHELIPGESTYITMLRRPVSLVLSQYGFVRRTPGHRHHEQAQRMTLVEYIQSGLAQEMNNSQTRAIAGAVDVPYGENPPELLEQAKRHIEERFRVVGLTERFDESLLLLRRAFGWSRIQYVRANVAPRGTPPAPEDVALVESMNALDLELYRWAEERFDVAVAARPDFAEELARFHARQSLYRPWGAVTYTWPRAVRARLRA